MDANQFDTLCVCLNDINNTLLAISDELHNISDKLNIEDAHKTISISDKLDEIIASLEKD